MTAVRLSPAGRNNSGNVEPIELGSYLNRATFPNSSDWKQVSFIMSSCVLKLDLWTSSNLSKRWATTRTWFESKKWHLLLYPDIKTQILSCVISMSVKKPTVSFHTELYEVIRQLNCFQELRKARADNVLLVKVLFRSQSNP